MYWLFQGPWLPERSKLHTWEMCYKSDIDTLDTSARAPYIHILTNGPLTFIFHMMAPPSLKAFGPLIAIYLRSFFATASIIRATNHFIFTDRKDLFRFLHIHIIKVWRIWGVHGFLKARKKLHGHFRDRVGVWCFVQRMYVFIMILQKGILFKR